MPRGRAKAAPPAPAMEYEKENVADGACVPLPKSPPVRATKKGLSNTRNYEEEIEAMAQKLNKITLEKEEAEKTVQEQDAKLKEQQEQIEMHSKEQEKLQDKLKKLQKVKEFNPVLSVPLLSDTTGGDSKKKQKKNDPDRLKRPMPPFFLWCNDHREQVRAENPKADLKETSTILGDLWRKVSEEEKKKYEDVYQKNKEEYLKLVTKERREAEALKLLHEEQSKKSALELLQQYIEYQKEIKVVDEKSKKKQKDPEKPKRPLSAYMVYCNERRPVLMAEKHTVPQIGKILGEEWRGMDEAARAPYEKIAAAGKATYADEMGAYDMKKAEENEAAEKAMKEKVKMDRICGLELLKQKEKEAEVKKAMKGTRVARKVKVKSTEPGKLKKPHSAYMLFTMDYRKRLQTEKAGATFVELNALVSSKWREMTEEEKRPFAEQAAVAKENYQKAVEELKRISPNSADEATASEE